MNVRSLIVLAGTSVAFIHCNNEPAKDKPRAQVTDVAATVAPAATALVNAGKAIRHTFSQDGSKIEFVGAKVTGKHDGHFGTFNGTVQVTDGKPETGSVTVELDSASIVADDAKLTGHLKSKDFLDVEKHPKIRFTSTSVRPGGEKGATHTITGNLEMHGVTKAITFPATVRTRADGVDVDSEFAINRKDFGIVYPGKPDDLIKDDILVRLNIRAKKAP